MTEPDGTHGVDPIAGRPIRILLVEDSPSDAAMTVATLREARVANEIDVVGDGDLAMAYLRHALPYESAPRPDLVLLDLNLPRKDGREVLAEMKEDGDLKAIPVVVLTSSAAETDIVKSYELHANSFVTKPVGLDEFLDAIRVIEEFWLALVQLPGGQGP